MGRRFGSVICTDSSDNTCFRRQKDAAANAGDIWSNGSADGRRGGRRVVGLSNAHLVDLFALVPPDTVSIDLLGPVSITGIVEKDAAVCGYRDFSGQRSSRLQHDTVSANQCLYDGVFGVDGLSDGFDDPDNGEQPAQSAQSRDSKVVVA